MELEWFGLWIWIGLDCDAPELWNCSRFFILIFIFIFQNVFLPFLAFCHFGILMFYVIIQINRVYFLYILRKIVNTSGKFSSSSIFFIA